MCSGVAASTVAALGSRAGAVTEILYLAAGAAGLRVCAPSAELPPGALRLLGPTGGYLMAYPIAAFVAGYFAERGWDRRRSEVDASLPGRARHDFSYLARGCAAKHHATDWRSGNDRD